MRDEKEEKVEKVGNVDFLTLGPSIIELTKLDASNG